MKWYLVVLLLSLTGYLGAQTVRDDLMLKLDFTTYPPHCFVCQLNITEGTCEQILLPKGRYSLPYDNAVIEVGELGTIDGTCVTKDEINKISYTVENGWIQGYTTVSPVLGTHYVSEIRDSVIYTNSFRGELRLGTGMNYYLRPESSTVLIRYTDSGDIESAEQTIGTVRLNLQYTNNELVRIEKVDDQERLLMVITIRNAINRQSMEVYDLKNTCIYNGAFTKEKVKEYLPEMLL